MDSDHYTECTFLIPIHRDENFSDGQLHDAAEWDWLKEQMWKLFNTPGTLAPGLYEGGYIDPDMGERVLDQSRKFFVAVPERDVRKVQRMLMQACKVFGQKCIYLSVAGKVELVEIDES